MLLNTVRNQLKNSILTQIQPLVLLQTHTELLILVLKRFLLNFIQKLPIDKLDFIFGHLLNGLLIVTIFYILMVYFTKHSAEKERTKLQRAVDKEHLRPAQIVKKISQEGKD